MSRAQAHGSAGSVRGAHDDLDVRTTATLTRGAVTQRVAEVRSVKRAPAAAGELKRSKAIKSSARRILQGRKATITICISLDVADLAAIDHDASDAMLARSTYLVECWRKARSGSSP